ncbi:MAG: hypothetical protein AAGE65_12735 [Planctomycetota bacterium]
MTRPPTKPGGFVAAALLAAALLGCATPATDDGPRDAIANKRLATLTNPDRSIGLRIDTAASLDLAEPQSWAAATRVAWANREPTRLRLHLLAELLAIEPTRFWADAVARWRHESNAAVDHWLLERAAESNADARSAVLQRWAHGARRRTNDAAMSEALLATAGKPREADGNQLLRATLQNHRAWPDRWAAWVLLARLEDRRTLAAWLEQTATRDRGNLLLRDLDRAGRWLGVWPTRPWELWAWRSHVRDETAMTTWQSVFTALPTPRRDETAVRHVPWLLSRPHPATDVSLDEAAARWLGRQMQHEAMRREAFGQADADHADPRSEHGGLVLLDNQGRSVLRPYAPARRRHDRAYDAPASLSLDLGDAVATYHFHAEHHDNAEHAGPGSGDRRVVERSATLMLVLTFVDRNTLALHVAAPGNGLFELGVIHRP